MFVNKGDPKWVDVPNEAGCSFGFAVLSGEEMDEAQVRNIERTLKMDISKGMSEALVKAPTKGGDDEKPIEFRDCNNAVMVEYGLVGWKGGPYDGVRCDTGARKRLDDASFRWAARQIFELSHISAGEELSSEPSTTDGAGRIRQSSEQPSSPSSTPAELSQAGSRSG